jgi:methionyl-tRNA formyltransferase
MPNVVFFGTPELAVPSLRALAASEAGVSLVVTRRDRRAGRGRKVVAPPVKTEAERLGIPVRQVSRISAAPEAERFRADAPDLAVVVAYGEILRPHVLATPARGFICMHPSLLPRYRGPAPIHWPILHGDTETGVTIIQVANEVDAGAILAQTRVPIAPDETAGDLHNRLAELGARLLADTVLRVLAGESTPTPQDDALACLAPKLEKSDGWIDWAASADDLRNFIRGMTHWPSAFSDLAAAGNGKRLRITLHRAEPTDQDSAHAARPGTIVRVTQHDLVVACGRGALSLETLQPAGKRAMTVTEFLNGHAVCEGDRFESRNVLPLDRLIAKTRIAR